MTMAAYLRVAEAQRRPGGVTQGGTPDLKELVRLGTLAASSHNTQPWRFELMSQAIRIHPDLERRCPAVDPEDAHLWRSLGCAAENIVLAAPPQGLAASVRVVDDAVDLSLAPSPATEPDPLALAIPGRQCCRSPYDGQPLSAEDRRAIEAASRVAGARAVLVTGDEPRSAIADLVAEGNRIQLGDRSFRSELFRWMRFSDREAIARGDGLAGRVLGMPSVPRWLGRLLVGAILSGPRQADTDRRLIRSSSAVAVIVSPGDGPEAWVAAGRASQRLQLQVTALGLVSAFLNQPIEVSALRPRLEALLDLLPGERAHLILRLGRGPRRPDSLRRPPAAVIAAR